MPRNGWTREKVIRAAADLIEERGPEAFSMRALAQRLNIKTASLYNHVESMEELMSAVCLYALELQARTETEAMEGKTGAERITALALACRRFAKERRELYRLVLRMAVSGYDRRTEPTQYVVGPFLQALEGYDLTLEEKYHWQRILRGIIHGFVSQEDAGFFSHLPVEVDTTFRIAVDTYILGLEQAERRARHES